MKHVSVKISNHDGKLVRQSQILSDFQRPILKIAVLSKNQWQFTLTWTRCDSYFTDQIVQDCKIIGNCSVSSWSPGRGKMAVLNVFGWGWDSVSLIYYAEQENNHHLWVVLPCVNMCKDMGCANKTLWNSTYLQRAQKKEGLTVVKHAFVNVNSSSFKLEIKLKNLNVDQLYFQIMANRLLMRVKMLIIKIWTKFIINTQDDEMSNSIWNKLLTFVRKRSFTYKHNSALIWRLVTKNKVRVPWFYI